jgi:hypothetical protein
MKIFDFAESSLIVGKRNETNVPSQALFMMNSNFIMESSEKIAKRVRQSGDDSSNWDAPVTRAFRLVLGRAALPVEMTRASELISSHADAEAGFVSFCQALLSSAEFRYLN